MSQEDSYQNNEINIVDETSVVPSEHGGENKKKSTWSWILGVFVVLLISAVVLLILAQQAPETTMDDSWERIKLAGVLRVATSADYPPFSY